MIKLAELYLNIYYDCEEASMIDSLYYDPEKGFYIHTSSRKLFDYTECSNVPYVFDNPYSSLKQFEDTIEYYLDYVDAKSGLELTDKPFLINEIGENISFFEDYSESSRPYADYDFPINNPTQLFIPFDFETKVTEIWSRLVKKYFPGKEK